MLELVLHMGLVTVLAEIPAAPVLGVMAFGLVMAIVGHVVKDNRLVALGIGLVFVATALMVILAYVDFQSGTDLDPRPEDPKLPSQVYDKS